MNGGTSPKHEPLFKPNESIMTTLRLFILIAIFCVGVGCKKDEPAEEPQASSNTGSVFASVKVQGELVGGATVATNPETAEYITEPTGNIMMSDISEGTYQIYALKENVGSGSATVQITSGELNHVTIHLQPGVFENPLVDIISSSALTIPVSALLEVKASVIDNSDSAEELSFEWSTDVDGVISNQGIGTDGFASMEHAFDIVGTRLLTLTVTDSEGNSGSDEVTIHVVEGLEPVQLSPVVNDDNGFHFHWSASNAEDFEKYNLYRQGAQDFELIAVQSDLHDTTYIDQYLQVDQMYSYQVGVVRTDGLEVLSNIESGVFEGNYIDIGTGLHKLRADPNSQMIYGLDIINRSLVYIDTELNQVVYVLDIDYDPVDMDLSSDFERMYIAHGISNQVSVVNLSQQIVETTFTVDTWGGTQSGEVSTVAALSDNRLAYMCDKNHHRLFLCNAIDGQLIEYSENTYSKSYISRNHTGTGLFIGEYSSSGSHLFRIDVINDEIVEQDESVSVSYSKPVVNVTANGEYVFYNRKKYLSQNLSLVLGTFDEFIYSINSDGSRVLGTTKLFDGYSYEAIADLPFETEVSVFSNDGNNAFLYDENTSRLYVIDTQ